MADDTRNPESPPETLQWLVSWHDGRGYCRRTFAARHMSELHELLVGSGITWSQVIRVEQVARSR